MPPYIRKTLANELIYEDDYKRVERINGKTWVFTTCCECGSKIERYASKGTANQQRFYCSRDCLNQSQRTGIAKKVKENHFIEVYGVINPGAIPEVRQKVKKTMIVRYGVENCFQLPKIKQTLLERYGTDVVAHIPGVREKTEQTCLERYGKTSFLATQENREALRNWSMNEYGTEHPMKSKEFQEKLKDVYIERYGVENPLQIEEVKDKVRKTCLEKYGVDNVFKRPDVIENRLKKISENAKRFSSDGEDEVYEILRQNFDVVRHPIVYYRERNFWVIDFYLKDKDIFIEYDGIFWHGIGKDVDELRKSAKNGNRVAKMQLNARRKMTFQDVWFQKNNMKLFRINECEDPNVWAERLRVFIEDKI